MNKQLTQKDYDFKLLDITRDYKNKKLFIILRYSDGLSLSLSEQEVKGLISRGANIKYLKTGPFGHLDSELKQAKLV